VGSGKGISNGEIATITQKILKKHGFKLKVNMNNPIANGEAHTAVLKVADTVSTFGLKRPSASNVEKAVEDAVSYCLHNGQTAATTVSSEKETGRPRGRPPSHFLARKQV
jgi:hypothetical protein